MGWKRFSLELSIQFMTALSQAILTLLLWASEKLGESVCFQWPLHCSGVLWLLVLCKQCCVGCHHPHVLDTPFCSHYVRCSRCAVQSGWALLRSLIATCLMADQRCAACYLNRARAWLQPLEPGQCLKLTFLQIFGLLNALPVTELLGEGSWVGFWGGDLSSRISRGYFWAALNSGFTFSLLLCPGTNSVAAVRRLIEEHWSTPEWRAGAVLTPCASAISVHQGNIW